MTRDRRLSLGTDGAMPELPAAHGDARVHLVFDGAQVASLAFAAKGRRTEVPAEWLARVRTRDVSGLSLAGCWYHALAVLPPYVSLHFADPDGTPVSGERPGVLFLFSLADACLLSVEHLETDADGQSMRHVTLLARDLPGDVDWLSTDAWRQE